MLPSPSVSTLELAFGFQLVALPVVVSKAAILFRAAAPMFEKLPPTYNVFPLNANALTENPVGLGFHEVARPEFISRAAIRLRDCPPIEVNVPPT